MKRVFILSFMFILLVQLVTFGMEATLRLSKGNGELGSNHNIVSVYLNNDVPIHAVQMWIADIPDFLKPDSVWLTDRCKFFTVSSNDDSSGAFNIIIISYNPTFAIAPDTGAILNISYSVAPETNNFNELALVFYKAPILYNKEQNIKVPTTTVSGSFTIGSTSVGNPILDMPSTYNLEQNYPNPFNPMTRIAFTMPKRDHVLIDIYNLLGQQIRFLTNREYAPGRYELFWDGTDDLGRQVAGGIYLYRIKTTSFTQTNRMVLTK